MTTSRPRLFTICAAGRWPDRRTWSARAAGVLTRIVAD